MVRVMTFMNFQKHQTNKIYYYEKFPRIKRLFKNYSQLK